MLDLTTEERDQMDRILEVLAFNTSYSYVDVSAKSGMCRASVSKYVAYLEAEKKVSVERNGRWRKVRRI